MIASSLAEVISLGSVIPFLAILGEPERIWVTPTAQFLASLLGWNRAEDLVLPICFVFAAAALLAGIVRLLAVRTTISLANGIGSDLSIEVFRRILYQSYSVHIQRNSSDAISAIASEVDQVVVILNSLLQILTALLITLGIVGVLLWFNPTLTMGLAIVVGGGYSLAMRISRRRLKVLGPSVVRDQAQRIRSLQESLGAIRDIILDGLQTTYTDIYASADRRLRHHRGQAQFLALAPRYGMESIGMTTIALSALTLTANQSSFVGALPQLGALALGAQRLLPSLQMIYGSWNSCRLNLSALSSVLAYLQQPISDADLLQSTTPVAFNKCIEFRQIGFQYTSESPLLFSGINLTIRRGERIGIIGETGVGKSTLVDLLMGLLQPSFGELLVDDAPITGQLLRSWRASVAHVPQSIFLADTSIAQNIAFGVPASQIDLKRLQLVAQQAQISSFIDRLPQGYDTLVGERGVRLSGGQRQRIGIARALYKEAPLLVLDEATSALDNSTESILMNAIHALSPSLTIVMIAHRLSTLDECDRIIRVTNGGLQFL